MDTPRRRIYSINYFPICFAVEFVINHVFLLGLTSGLEGISHGINLMIGISGDPARDSATCSHAIFGCLPQQKRTNSYGKIDQNHPGYEDPWRHAKGLRRYGFFSIFDSSFASQNLKNRLWNVRNVQSISEIMDFTWFHESWICVLRDVQSISDNSLGHRRNIFGTIEFRGMGSQTGPENGVYTIVYTEYILVYPQPSLREDESLDPKPILKAKWKSSWGSWKECLFQIMFNRGYAKT